MYALILKLFWLFMMTQTFAWGQTTSTKSPKDIVGEIHEKLQIYLNESIPTQQKQILSNIRKECREAMVQIFPKCLEQFKLNSEQAQTANAYKMVNNDELFKEYDFKWPACCAIYRHQDCIKRAFTFNAHYSRSSCDQNDVSTTEDIINVQLQRKQYSGFCPSDEHIEYMLCDQSQFGLIGNNFLTQFALVIASLSLLLAITLSSYIIFMTRRKLRKPQSKFQLLEPTEMDMYSTNHSHEL